MQALARNAVPRSPKGAEVDLARAQPWVVIQSVVSKALKGPAAKMLEELGHPVSAAGVASFYDGVATHFVLDRRDTQLKPAIEKGGMQVIVQDTIMTNLEEKMVLAERVLEMI